MVPGSIPGGVTGFFSDIFPSDRIMGLGSTQPLVKMSTRDIPGGKGGWCVRLTTSPPSCAECHEIWKPKPPETLWATPGLLRACSSLLTNRFHELTKKRVLLGKANLPTVKSHQRWNVRLAKSNVDQPRGLVVRAPDY